MSTCLVGIGANLGDRAATIRTAVGQLAAHPATASLAASRNHETTPVGGPAGQPDFLNAAARLETSLQPSALLDLFREIEQQCGRQRGEHWAARTLDLDLLLYDQTVIATDRLAVPHPGLVFRRFVLEPAVEVAADLLHARMGWSVQQLLDHLDASCYYLAIGGGDHPLRRQLAEEVASGLGGRHLHDPAQTRSDAAAGPQGTRALESLVAQARTLAEASWPGNTQLAVSDFWFDGWSLRAEPTPQGQSTPQGHTTSTQGHAGGRGQTVGQAWQTLRGDVVTPRLTVLFDGGDDQNGEDRPIREYAARPTLGPMLVVSTDDWPRAVAETIAACQAMQ